MHRSLHTATLVTALLATGLMTAPDATAAPGAPAVLAIDAPLTASVDNAVAYIGSLRIDNGSSVTCLTVNTDGGVTDGRINFTTSYEVTSGTTYGISAWESTKCDTYVPEWGRNTRSLGGVTVTPSAADVADGVWHVTIP